MVQTSCPPNPSIESQSFAPPPVSTESVKAATGDQDSVLLCPRRDLGGRGEEKARHGDGGTAGAESEYRRRIVIEPRPASDSSRCCFRAEHDVSGGVDRDGAALSGDCDARSEREVFARGWIGQGASVIEPASWRPARRRPSRRRWRRRHARDDTPIRSIPGSRTRADSRGRTRSIPTVDSSSVNVVTSSLDNVPMPAGREHGVRGGNNRSARRARRRECGRRAEEKFPPVLVMPPTACRRWSDSDGCHRWC